MTSLILGDCDVIPPGGAVVGGIAVVFIFGLLSEIKMKHNRLVKPDRKFVLILIYQKLNNYNDTSEIKYDYFFHFVNFPFTVESLLV